MTDFNKRILILFSIFCSLNVVAQTGFDNFTKTSFTEAFEYPMPIVDIEQDAFVVKSGSITITSIDSLRFLVTIDNQLVNSSPATSVTYSKLDSSVHYFKIVFFDKGISPIEFSHKGHERNPDAYTKTEFHIFELQQKTCFGLAPVSRKVIQTRSKTEDEKVVIPKSNKKGKPSYAMRSKETGVSVYATYAKYPSVSAYQVANPELSTVVLNCVWQKPSGPVNDACDQAPLNCKLQNDNARFTTILDDVLELRADSKKEELIMEQKRFYCMTTAEVRKLVETVKDQEIRLRLIKSLFNVCTDRKNYLSLNSLLENKEAASLTTFLNVRCPKTFPINK